MQNQKFKMKLFRILGKRGRITIPYEIRQRVGFKYNDVLSFTEAPDGRTVIIKRERICDCELNGKDVQKENKNDEVTLFDFLNGLSAEQQRAALVHLSLNQWQQERLPRKHPQPPQKPPKKPLSNP